MRSRQSHPRQPARSHQILAILGCALLAAAATIPSAAATVDDAPDAGLWYLTKTGVETAQQRATGAGITVAVIDGPINPDVPDLTGTNLITYPTAFCEDADGTQHPSTATIKDSVHATNMVSIIIGTGAGTDADGRGGVRGVAPDATVRHYASKHADRVSCKTDGPVAPGIGGAINQAVNDGATIISISQNGDAPTASELEATALAERAGVIVVAGSKDRGGSVLGWPASSNGVVSVESVDVTGQLNPEAVTNPLLTVAAPGEGIRLLAWSDEAWDDYAWGNGSSQATAWTSGVLALVWSAYPDATANQIIQTLLRSTATNDGELVRNDSYGYGVVSVTRMLAVDPTTYPDVNPLLRDDPTALPAYADIIAPTTPVPAATSETTTATEPSATAGTSKTPLLLGGAGLLALLLAAGATLALLRARHRQPPHLPSPNHP